jgi:uncharacterized membrane protein
LAFILGLTLAFLGVVLIAQQHFRNKWWDDCKTHGGHVMGINVAETMFTGRSVSRESF